MMTLTVENAREYYRVNANNFDFATSYKFDREAVKKSVEEYGIEFTACDYNVFAVVIKKVIQ